MKIYRLIRKKARQLLYSDYPSMGYLGSIFQEDDEHLWLKNFISDINRNIHYGAMTRVVKDDIENIQEIITGYENAPMVKLVYTPDSKSGAEMYESSNLSRSNIDKKTLILNHKKFNALSPSDIPNYVFEYTSKKWFGKFDEVYDNKLCCVKSVIKLDYQEEIAEVKNIDIYIEKGQYKTNGEVGKRFVFFNFSMRDFTGYSEIIDRGILKILIGMEAEALLLKE